MGDRAKKSNNENVWGPTRDIIAYRPGYYKEDTDPHIEIMPRSMVRSFLDLLVRVTWRQIGKNRFPARE